MDLSILKWDETSRYMLLDRMRSDCEYYFGYGNRHAKHLWAGNEKDQIAYMKAVWESFPEGKKPEWLSMDDILQFEKKMVGEKLPLNEQITAAASGPSDFQHLSAEKSGIDIAER